MNKRVYKIILSFAFVFMFLFSNAYAGAGDTLTGDVAISGTLKFGETLTADVTNTNNTGTLSYQWIRGVTDIPSATAQTYVLAEADIGELISVRVTSDVENVGSISSLQTTAIDKADASPATGVTPVLSSKNDVSITVTAVAGYEYVITANDVAINPLDWQDSNVFAGLTPNTPYDIYQRVKETATHNASATSAKLDESTDPSVLSGTAEITGSAVYGETLTAALTGGNNTGTLSYQWVRGASDINLATNSTYVLTADDIGEMISVKITSSVETGTVTSAQTSAVTKAVAVPATGVTPVTSSKDDVSITVTSVVGYEYVITDNDVAINPADWQDSNVFAGLTPNTQYDIYQRVKETATHFSSATSAKLDESTDPSTLTGTASITGTETYGETLTASLSGTNNSGTLSYQWIRGASDIPSATSSTYILVADDVGQLISIRISSSVETGAVTSTQTGAIAKAASDPATGITPVLSSKTDTSVTLTAVAGYEYVITDNDVAINPADWQDSNEFTSLTANTDYDFYQRVKATATHNASADSAKLDVKTDIATLTGTANISGTVKFGETLTASLSGGNNTGTLSYQWVRGASDISGANNSTYVLMLDDIGQKISVKITSSVETGTVTSLQTAAVDKADSIVAKGITPVLSSKTASTITIVNVVEYEYKILPSGADVSTGSWQSSNIFSSLTGSTTYDIYQRVKETATQNPSEPSDKLIVTTDAGSALTGNASITGTLKYGQTLTAVLASSNNTGTLSYQWMRGGVNIASATGSTYVLTATDIGNQISVKFTSSVEYGTITSPQTSAIQKAVSIPSKGIKPELYKKTTTSITLKSVTGYEYMIVSNGAHFSTGTWQSSNVFYNLKSYTSYDIYQRVKETSTHSASSVSDKLDVRTYSTSSGTSSTATPTPSPTAAPTLTPSPTPTVTVSPSPTVTPAPTTVPTEGNKQTIVPEQIEQDEKVGTVTVKIDPSQLPEGTTAIKTADGKIITVSGTTPVYITVDKDTISEDGAVEIVALNDEGVALGYVNIDASSVTQEQKSGGNVLMWVIIGLAGVLAFVGITYLIARFRNKY